MKRCAPRELRPSRKFPQIAQTSGRERGELGASLPVRGVDAHRS
jgi:hypothetical protein